MTRKILDEVMKRTWPAVHETHCRCSTRFWIAKFSNNGSIHSLNALNRAHTPIHSRNAASSALRPLTTSTMSPSPEKVTSPLSAAGRVYFFAEDGSATVTATGRDYKVLATNKLADGFMASPAVTGDSLILRTKTHVYRVTKR